MAVSSTKLAVLSSRPREVVNQSSPPPPPPAPQTPPPPPPQRHHQILSKVCTCLYGWGRLTLHNANPTQRHGFCIQFTQATCTGLFHQPYVSCAHKLSITTSTRPPIMKALSVGSMASDIKLIHDDTNGSLYSLYFLRLFIFCASLMG